MLAVCTSRRAAFIRLGATLRVLSTSITDRRPGAEGRAL